jgi:hypothetical protein
MPRRVAKNCPHTGPLAKNCPHTGPHAKNCPHTGPLAKNRPRHTRPRRQAPGSGHRGQGTGIPSAGAVAGASVYGVTGPVPSSVTCGGPSATGTPSVIRTTRTPVTPACDVP